MHGYSGFLQMFANMNSSIAVVQLVDLVAIYPAEKSTYIHSVVYLDMVLFVQNVHDLWYHNYAASGYIIRYEHVVARYLGTSRHSCQKSATLDTKAANRDSGRSLQQLYESRAHRRA